MHGFGIFGIVPALISICYGLDGISVMESTLNNVGLVSILVTKKKGGQDDACSGAAISPDYIITGGACVDQGPIARIRVYYTEKPDAVSRQGGYEALADLDSIRFPPGYDRYYCRNDIAVFKLQKPITSTIYKFYSLPSKAMATPNAYAGLKDTRQVMIGWGYYGNKGLRFSQQVVFVALTHEECKKIYSDAEPELICMDPNYNSLCTGDGGSPAVKYDSGVLMAIASFSRMTCGGQRPSIASNVAYHLDFIKNVTGVVPPSEPPAEITTQPPVDPPTGLPP